ncbi:hypothetical protein SCP_0401710 [Sparassis crispa]|uniref:Uncharacterized protein n=1 Tax=Sparassis crispa TaxID=139825 RepID=A0A401GI16_9APHY|nr:hypothetical protein SCP_0401710 [Sparassis crispa]GBE81798.1 hypothetical protein SCP_0401710 [Sparassis crispa]
MPLVHSAYPVTQTLILHLPFRPAILSHEAAESILSGRWSDLHSLSLNGAVCPAATAISFFISHPQMSELSIDELVGYDIHSDGHLEAFDCPPGLLPNLKKLESVVQHVVELLSAPCAQPRPIEHISINHWRRAWCNSQEEDFAALLATLHSITTVTLPVTNIDLVARIAQAAPWLTRLRVPLGAFEILSDLYSDKEKVRVPSVQ